MFFCYALLLKFMYSKPPFMSLTFPKMTYKEITIIFSKNDQFLELQIDGE